MHHLLQALTSKVIKRGQEQGGNIFHHGFREEIMSEGRIATSAIKQHMFLFVGLLVLPL